MVENLRPTDQLSKNERENSYRDQLKLLELPDLWEELGYYNGNLAVLDVTTPIQQIYYTVVTQGRLTEDRRDKDGFPLPTGINCLTAIEYHQPYLRRKLDEVTWQSLKTVVSDIGMIFEELFIRIPRNEFKWPEEFTKRPQLSDNDFTPDS